MISCSIPFLYGSSLTVISELRGPQPLPMPSSPSDFSEDDLESSLYIPCFRDTHDGNQSDSTRMNEQFIFQLDCYWPSRTWLMSKMLNIWSGSYLE